MWWNGEETGVISWMHPKNRKVKEVSCFTEGAGYE